MTGGFGFFSGIAALLGYKVMEYRDDQKIVNKKQPMIYTKPTDIFKEFNYACELYWNYLEQIPRYEKELNEASMDCVKKQSICFDPIKGLVDKETYDNFYKEYSKRCSEIRRKAEQEAGGDNPDTCMVIALRRAKEYMESKGYRAVLPERFDLPRSKDSYLQDKKLWDSILYIRSGVRKV
jgi:hypothetical protein